MKILFRRAYPEDLRLLIRKAYEDDHEMKSIHILEGASLEEMVEYTYRQVMEDEMSSQVKIYGVYLDHTLIGYTTLVLDPIKLLFTFGINIHYRTKDVLIGWLKTLDRYLGHSYMLTVREKNERTMKFFKRNGFEVKHNPDQKEYVIWRQAQSSRQ